MFQTQEQRLKSMKICLNTGITTKLNVYSTIRPYFTKRKRYQSLIYHYSDFIRIRTKTREKMSKLWNKDQNQ